MPVQAGTEPLLDTGRGAPPTLRDHLRLIDQDGISSGTRTTGLGNSYAEARRYLEALPDREGVGNAQMPAWSARLPFDGVQGIFRVGQGAEQVNAQFNYRN